ncbi:MAG: HAMP domain-containing protein [Endomicrobium sp.]|jgi:signal transduction histidine kinase|nr:HAMP domain-containing protein [Endomicrobium sp.]
MKIRFKASLRAQLVVLVVVIVVFVVVVFSSFFISTYKSSFIQSLQLDTKRQAYRLADSVVSGICLGRNDIVEHYVGNITRESDIVCVEVYGKDFNRLANFQVLGKQLENFLASRKMSENVDVVFKKQKSVEYFYKYKGKIRAFEFISPVVSYKQENVNGEVIGFVRVIASLKSIDERLSKIVKSIVLLAVYIVVISSLLWVMAIRMFLEPINKIVSVAKQISQGDLSSKVPMFKIVELRILAVAVNVMSRHLKKVLNVLDNEKERLLGAKKSLELKNQSIKDLIAKERQLHVEIKKEERFYTIGKLAGSLAHEIKNPLAGLKNAIYFISKAENFRNEKSKEMIRIFTDNITRINNILTELLDYSEVSNINKTQNYVDELVNEIIKATCLPSNVSLKMDLKHIAVLIDEKSFEKIIRHLVKNAVDAMPSGGKISISVGKVDTKLELKIKDTGVGIDNEIRGKIYEPLYTTKVNGVGLGLSIVKRIVELHEGIILMNSKIGGGAEFSIYIPGVLGP